MSLPVVVSTRKNLITEEEEGGAVVGLGVVGAGVGSSALS